MPYFKFADDFRFKPARHVAVRYKKGWEGQVTTECSDAATKAGKGSVETKPTGVKIGKGGVATKPEDD